MRLKNSFTTMKDLFQKYKRNGGSEFVKMVEVSARDGLQNEKEVLSVAERVAIVNLHSKAGFKSIEIGSFVSPKWVPQMANTDLVWKQINKHKGVEYVALVPNLKGMESAVAADMKQIAIFASATQLFSQRNLNCSIKQSLQNYVPVLELAKKHGIRVRGYVSMVMGCPYEGHVNPQAVKQVVLRLLELGCYEVSLGDTVGRGTPQSTIKLMETLSIVDSGKLAAHFHDTEGRALENILIALQYGIRIVDSAVGGLGGCPYSKTPVGNVNTKSVLKMLQETGYTTGIDINTVQQTQKLIQEIMNGRRVKFQ